MLQRIPSVTNTFWSSNYRTLKQNNYMQYRDRISITKTSVMQLNKCISNVAESAKFCRWQPSWMVFRWCSLTNRNSGLTKFQQIRQKIPGRDPSILSTSPANLQTELEGSSQLKDLIVMCYKVALPNVPWMLFQFPVDIRFAHLTFGEPTRIISSRVHSNVIVNEILLLLRWTELCI